MKKHLFTITILVLLGGTALCQEKQTQQVQQVWLAYFNQIRFTDHWGMWTDIHLRSKEDFIEDFSTGLVRLGLTYYLTDDVKLTAGYAYVNHFPADAHPDISQPEHRPWQQIQWHTKYPKLRLMQWLRLEQRYRRRLAEGELADGYTFNYRLRYNFALSYPIGKRPYQPKTFSFVLSNELHINFGKEIVYNTFDHNRFSVGFAYHLTAHSNLQFGYMNFYQQTAAGDRYRSLHTGRLTYQHSLDLRRRDAGN